MFERASEYWTDAWQRSLLFLEALNERGNIHLEQAAKEVPNVLNFASELVLDGRTLPRPVNYGLVRILPPEGVRVDPAKPPVVAVDPRAGHGPGIAGMKPDSEIGVALRAGHPCYFVGSHPSRCRARRSRMSAAPRRPSSRRRPIAIRRLRASRSSSPTARPAGRP